VRGKIVREPFKYRKSLMASLTSLIVGSNQLYVASIDEANAMSGRHKTDNQFARLEIAPNIFACGDVSSVVSRVNCFVMGVP
jgi:hypothetical protein